MLQHTIAGLPVVRDLFRVGGRVRLAQRPAELPPKKTVLCLSGGRAFGAFQAGLLVGWTETGTRPAFDSITGVSTGALVAVLAFLGLEYDAELKRAYTASTTADIYRNKRTARGLLSGSLNDNGPLGRLIDGTITPAALDRIAEEHRRGRRLYIATDLDGRRPVVWDLGAIAAKGEPNARELVCKLLLASAAIPAFFSPVERASANLIVAELSRGRGDVVTAVALLRSSAVKLLESLEDSRSTTFRFVYANTQSTLAAILVERNELAEAAVALEDGLRESAVLVEQYPGVPLYPHGGGPDPRRPRTAPDRARPLERHRDIAQGGD